MIEKKIEDKELGIITLIAGPRYKRYTLKIAGGSIRATMPAEGDERRMMSFIEENRDKLRKMLEKHPNQSFLDENTNLEMTSFRLSITRTERKNMRVFLNQGILTIEFPASIPLHKEIVQKKIREILKNVLRHEAKRLLPERVEALAQQYGFSYTGVKINSSRTRWGSCSSRKSINLSLYLMQLPWHLVDYVILHELCHTREMNHSDRFWSQMDQVTDKKAKALRRELKAFRTLDWQ